MKKKDGRATAAFLTVAAILLGGLLVSALPGESPSTAAASKPKQQAAGQRPHAVDIDARFKQGVVMLHAKQYEYAVAAFHQVLKYAPDMPEAHVNLGFALVGLKQFAAARDFFESATVLRARQANAYYGLAVALEGLGDLPGARGAMRTYLHLSDPKDPYRRKAEAALWEWESAKPGS